MAQIVSFQPEFSQRLPEVVGNLDYRLFRDTLHRIDELIELGSLEDPFIDHCLNQVVSERGSLESLSPASLERIIRQAREAFRCVIVLKLTTLSFRKLAERLADSPLLQKFCLLSRIDRIRVPSKSQLERYEKMFPVELLNGVMDQLTGLAYSPCPEHGGHALGLEKSISLRDIYVDATCVEANIHFPVDWVLLRDATRTLMKSIFLIRKAGLKNRMDSPSLFIRSMNKLSIEMTHARNRSTQKKEKKRVFRSMKKLMQKIEKHARKHQCLLEEFWKETNLTEGEVKQILKRIQNVLEQLPQAIHQANERIIGERQVKNKDKILSLYENDLYVCVRGKAGISAEFGNTLLLGEQENGLIVDWKLYQEQSPADPALLKESLERMQNSWTMKSAIKSVTTDRGMASLSNQKVLKKCSIEDFMCPRPPRALLDRLQEPDFLKHQRRRAQTEGRIGILKQKFLGKPLKSKNFEHRNISIAWAILTHNLWLVARLPQKESLEKTG